MKTIGLLGGMTWESTELYYRLINQEVQKRLGGLHSARILMHSVDFEDVAVLQRAGKWAEAGAFLAAAGRHLAEGGADILALCCNTMHCVDDIIEREAGRPLLHIADPLGEAILQAGIKTVGLLGTRYTMEMPAVISARLERRFGLKVLVPEDDDRIEIHRIIYEELGRGLFREEARAFCRRAMAALVALGAEGIILGCTELPLIVKAGDSTVPQFDTAALHARAIAAWAIEAL